jgi:hypothetical protein
MDGGRLRAAFAAFLIALAASLVAASPALDPLRGLSIDVLTALRWRLFGNAHPAQNSAAVVVALDEETFRTPPFDTTPSVTWTHEIGQVLTAIIDGGARVVGFDIIFPTSIEQSAVPFGDGTLGGRVRGFDHLRALALGARAGKVVLGQVQHQDRPLPPSPGSAAVGFGRNIRALNVHSDPDDVIRRMPLSFEVDGEKVPSMAAELVARAAEPSSDGAVPRPPRQAPDTLTLNFEGGADDIPTYSLADLHACAAKDDKDFFKRQFGGKVVLLGTVLDVEDRKITSKRFATAPGARGVALPMRLPEPEFPRTRSQASTSRDGGEQPASQRRLIEIRPPRRRDLLVRVRGAGRRLPTPWVRSRRRLPRSGSPSPGSRVRRLRCATRWRCSSNPWSSALRRWARPSATS